MSKKIIYNIYLATAFVTVGILSFALYIVVQDLFSENISETSSLQSMSIKDMINIATYEDNPGRYSDVFLKKINNMDNESSDAINLKITFAISTFLNGDNDDKEEVITMLRKTAEDNLSLPVARSLAVYLLVWAGSEYVHGGYQGDEFPFHIQSDQINKFSDEYEKTLQSALNTSGPDYIEARYSLLRQMAEFSRELYPVANNLMYLANVQSNLLLNLPYRTKRTDDTREKLLENLNTYIKEADRQKKDDLRHDYGQDKAAHASYLHWKGVVLGDAVLAGVNPEQSFEESFDEALKIIDEQEDLKNNLYGNYESLIYLHYALYLDAIYRQSSAEEVNLYLAKMNTLLGNKEFDNSNFDSYLAFIKKINEKEGYSHRYEYVSNLSKKSNEFREYLISRGWDL